MKKLKNLANCTPKEFIVQTNRIRHSVESWLKLTDIPTIRAQHAVINDDMTTEEREAANYEQGKKNLNEILDSVMEKHPDETVELLSMLCFVEKEDIDKYTMTEYLAAFNELIGNKEVVNFFTSLIQLGQMLTRSA